MKTAIATTICATCRRPTSVCLQHAQGVLPPAEAARLPLLVTAQSRLMPKTTPPRRLRRGDCRNFRTLLRAAGANDLALVSTIRKADRTHVALVCAMQLNDDQTITPIPVCRDDRGEPIHAVRGSDPRCTALMEGAP